MVLLGGCAEQVGEGDTVCTHQGQRSGFDHFFDWPRPQGHRQGEAERQIGESNHEDIQVFLREAIEEKLGNFTSAQREFIEQNEDNRKSFVFAALLKLYKFGDIKDFVEAVAKGLANLAANPAPACALRE